MLHCSTDHYIFNLDDPVEDAEYRKLKDDLDDSYAKYEEVIDKNYVVITLKKPNWRKF